MKWRMKKASDSKDMDDSPKFISIGRGMTDNSDDNKIYFYEEISQESILNLNKQIDEVSKNMKNIQFSYNLTTPPPIELHICSEGGDAMAVIASVDKISNNPVPIHTYVEGFAASAATMISVVGHKRFITKNSTMLVHQISSSNWGGTYANYKDEMKNLDLLMEIIRKIYLNHTKFDKDNLEKILGHDLFFGAEDCLRLGMVDTIL